MDLNVLTKLMAAKQEQGRTLFHTEISDCLPRAEPKSRKAKKENHRENFGRISTNTVRCFGRPPPYPLSQNLGTRLLNGQGLLGYFRAAWRVCGRLVRPAHGRRIQQLASMSTTMMGSGDHLTPKPQFSADGAPTVLDSDFPIEDSVIESVPLEVRQLSPGVLCCLDLADCTQIADRYPREVWAGREERRHDPSRSGKGEDTRLSSKGI